MPSSASCLRPPLHRPAARLRCASAAGAVGCRDLRNLLVYWLAEEFAELGEHASAGHLPTWSHTRVLFMIYGWATGRASGQRGAKLLMTAVAGALGALMFLQGTDRSPALIEVRPRRSEMVIGPPVGQSSPAPAAAHESPLRDEVLPIPPGEGRMTRRVQGDRPQATDLTRVR